LNADVSIPIMSFGSNGHVIMGTASESGTIEEKPTILDEIISFLSNIII
jgi:hypothetical protein